MFLFINLRVCVYWISMCRETRNETTRVSFYSDRMDCRETKAPCTIDHFLMILPRNQLFTRGCLFAQSTHVSVPFVYI